MQGRPTCLPVLSFYFPLNLFSVLTSLLQQLSPSFKAGVGGKVRRAMQDVFSCVYRIGGGCRYVTVSTVITLITQQREQSRSLPFIPPGNHKLHGWGPCLRLFKRDYQLFHDTEWCFPQSAQQQISFLFSFFSFSYLGLTKIEEDTENYPPKAHPVAMLKVF